MPKTIASIYEVLDELGSGGGGTVYLANHLRLGKKVVLKADKRSITARPELLRREVDVLKHLSHSHIPQVYDFFVENETVYTVMEYIEGESLDRPLKRGERYPLSQVIKWAKQLLEALSYLHRPVHGDPPRGYVHSDIKPANLMRTPDNDVCLIDFNIALALGEENVIGCSAGYASPEHYGLDFSSDYDTSVSQSKSGSKLKNLMHRGRNAAVSEAVGKEKDRTVLLQDAALDSTVKLPESGMEAESSKTRIMVPDVRSDIYSVGATLYHLLSGKRPARHAKEVEPLSQEEFSSQIAAIISKAMNPNPDLRYQTADEMLNAFKQLHSNDVRMLRWKRSNRTIIGLLSLLFAIDITGAFVGLKRMQATEEYLKLAEYSGNALIKGDGNAAIQYALRALPLKKSILEPDFPAQAQKALTDALGVYDLSDGFKIYKTLELPSEPLCVELSPDGRHGCCIYAFFLAVFDTETAEITDTFPVVESALSEVKFLDNERILYAGREGLQAYDINKGEVIWTGKPATAVRISGDGRRVAAVYRDEDFATVYNAENGEILCTVSFEGRHQGIVANDVGANPDNNILALNGDGSLLGVSFEDGALLIYYVDNPENGMEILKDFSGYSHFEGGFYQQYFAFSASATTESVFGIIDTDKWEQLWGFQADYTYSVQADESGVYVMADNILVKVHPVTGEQMPLATTSERLYHFAESSGHTLVEAEDHIIFFNENTQQISSYDKNRRSNFVRLSEKTALVGSSDSPVIQLMKYENHPETEIFAYDPAYEHDEARLSADRKHIMLFSYRGFRIYDTAGALVAEVSIPDEGQVYDQQYIRDGKESRLEVRYNDGKILAYDAETGVLLYESAGEKPDGTLDEEFDTDCLHITAPLHGIPKVYDQNTGKLITELDKEAFLTYATQADKYVVVQFITAEGDYYGQILNEKCEVLAELPWLCDVVGERLIFDYPTGNMRESRIYDIGELVSIAREALVQE